MPQDPTGEPTPHAAQSPGIDPDDLAASLRVLGSLHEFPAGHPHIETGKRAAATMRNRIRKARRGEARRAEREPLIEADRRVLKSTATGSPDRIDDETRGIPLVSSVRRTFCHRNHSPDGAPPTELPQNWLRLET